MAWGSFLLGGMAFGFVSFIVGAMLGRLASRQEEGSISISSLKLMQEDILHRLEVGEGYHINFNVFKTSNDGDDDENEEPVPVISDQNWRGN